MPIKIRQAALADAEAIAIIDIDSHITAYRPILGEDYWPDPSVGHTAEHWRRVLSRDPSLAEAPEEVLVAEREGAVVAYSGIGASRDEDAAGAGEVFAIYVHPTAWRGGAGRRLLQAATERLRQLDYTEVTLWVLEVNQRARAFYAAQGWQHDGATKPARGGRIFLRYRAPASREVS